MITVDDLKVLPALRDLSDAHLRFAAERAADLDLMPNEYLVHEGEVPAFFILLTGRLEVTKRVGGIERVIASRTLPGEYFGEVPLMLGASAFANLRASTPSRVIRLDPIDFHRLLEASPALAGAVSRSLSERVNGMGALSEEMLQAVVTVIGRHWEEQCHELREFLSRNRIAYDWISPDEACLTIKFPELAARVDQDCPMVRLHDGRTLVRPGLRELACALGLRVESERARYDLIVIGGGPAGLAAAVYGASEGLGTLMIEREAPGGQAGTSSRIENYLGFPSGLSGDDLGHRALEQAERLGAEIIVTRDVKAVVPGTDMHEVVLEDDTRLSARSLVIATGVMWCRLDIPGADALTGRGVYYGAARTEATATRGRDVYLIGAGNSAGQAAIYFANYARSVTLVVRGADIAASMSQYLIDQIGAKQNIHVQTRCQVVAVEGDEHLHAITVRDAEGREQRYETDSLFVFIGADAETDWLPEAILRDDRGYILTGLDITQDRRCSWPLERDPFLLETSVPSIFAAGDVRHGSIKRVAAGVGEGSMAIAFIHQALALDAPANTVAKQA